MDTIGRVAHSAVIDSNGEQGGSGAIARERKQFLTAKRANHTCLG